MDVSEHGYYTVADIAEGLKYSRSGLMKWIKENRLKAKKVGGKWIIKGTDLKIFLDGIV